MKHIILKPEHVKIFEETYRPVQIKVVPGQTVNVMTHDGATVSELAISTGLSIDTLNKYVATYKSKVLKPGDIIGEKPYITLISKTVRTLADNESCV